MQCHYAVLGVPFTVDDDELKKAYRKMALFWHPGRRTGPEGGTALKPVFARFSRGFPDKNMDRLDEATEKFKLVRAAYSVLSDPHERKWYDDHREAILRGHKHGGRDDDDGGGGQGEGVDVMPFFSASVFSGYADGDPQVRRLLQLVAAPTRG